MNQLLPKITLVSALCWPTVYGASLFTRPSTGSETYVFERETVYDPNAGPFGEGGFVSQVRRERDRRNYGETFETRQHIVGGGLGAVAGAGSNAKAVVLRNGDLKAFSQTSNFAGDRSTFGSSATAMSVSTVSAATAIAGPVEMTLSYSFDGFTSRRGSGVEGEQTLESVRRTSSYDVLWGVFISKNSPMASFDRNSQTDHANQVGYAQWGWSSATTPFSQFSDNHAFTDFSTTVLFENSTFADSGFQALHNVAGNLTFQAVPGVEYFVTSYLFARTGASSRTYNDFVEGELTEVGTSSGTALSDFYNTGSFDVSSSDPNAIVILNRNLNLVPEPSSALLLGGGALLALGLRRREA